MNTTTNKPFLKVKTRTGYVVLHDIRHCTTDYLLSLNNSNTRHTINGDILITEMTQYTNYTYLAA